jgi:hypothetical protein
MWSDSPQVLRQIDGIGPKKVAQLIQGGIENLANLRSRSVSKIEAVGTYWNGRRFLILFVQLCNRDPPFGLQIKQKLCYFPTIHLNVTTIVSLHYFFSHLYGDLLY